MNLTLNESQIKWISDWNKTQSKWLSYWNESQMKWISHYMNLILKWISGQMNLRLKWISDQITLILKWISDQMTLTSKRNTYQMYLRFKLILVFLLYCKSGDYQSKLTSVNSKSVVRVLSLMIHFFYQFLFMSACIFMSSPPSLSDPQPVTQHSRPGSSWCVGSGRQAGSASVPAEKGLSSLSSARS